MAKQRKQSTQKHLPIKEIRDGIVVLKNGGLRTILMVSAVNFNLKSNREQKALLASYANFLNGLYFPIQIVAQSRTLDLDKYLQELEDVAKTQSNSLLQTQTNEYIGFVRELIGVANIMSKTFYVIVPYEVAPISAGWFARLFGQRSPTLTQQRFADLKSKILERTNVISTGLASLGLNNIQLNTQEVIELFYSIYNPDVSRRQKLFSVSNVDVSVIQKMRQS